jgi:hypothetical protein
MISQARLEGNRRNAKKSTGPRSAIGKKRSSMNAMKHGMTARVALLPDEDPAKFDRRMTEWVRDYRPENDRELYRVERAVYCSWQIQRTTRSRFARLSHRAHTADKERRDRENRAYWDLTLRLFRLPSNAPSQECETRNADANQAEKPGLVEAGKSDDGDHPAMIVLGLQGVESGCRWLLDRWNELSTVLDENLAWERPERFKAIRLLGLDDRNLLDAPAIVAILQACQVLSPHAVGIVDEFMNELLAAHPGWSMERLREWVPEMPQPADEAAARQDLVEIAKAEIAELEAKLEEHAEAAAVEERLSAHELAFDHSPEAERMRRYETTCERYVDRYLNELMKRMSDDTERPYAQRPQDYAAPRPLVFRRTDGPSGSPAQADLSAVLDSKHERERNGDRGPEAGESTRAKLAMALAARQGCEPAASLVRNEPTAADEPNSPQIAKKNELIPKQAVVAGVASERILRNEPTVSGLASAQLSIGGVKHKGGSRRERRARRARERATGRGEPARALASLGVANKSLLRPIGL